jgi:hypothetical protein
MVKTGRSETGDGSGGTCTVSGYYLLEVCGLELPTAGRYRGVRYCYLTYGRRRAASRHWMIGMRPDGAFLDGNPPSYKPLDMLVAVLHWSSLGHILPSQTLESGKIDVSALQEAAAQSCSSKLHMLPLSGRDLSLGIWRYFGRAH